MKRVTPKVRSVKTVTAMRHLVFTSVEHERDRLAAERLRSVDFIAIPLEGGGKPPPFPRAAEFSGVGVYESGVLKVKTPGEFEAALKAARAVSGQYWAESKVTKKDGSPVLQKRETNGLRDCYFSFPPWVTEHLAQMVEKGEARRARVVAAKVMMQVGLALGERTGYIPIGAALHPDNRLALGFHIQFQVVSDGRLLGRSADGKSGRKGLVLLGDSNLGLARFAEFISVGSTMGKKFQSKDWDDLAFDKVMTRVLKQELAGDWEAIERAGKEYAQKWKKKRDEALNERNKAARLEGQLKALKDESDFLKSQNKSLSEDRGKLVEAFDTDLKVAREEADSLRMQNKTLAEENAKLAAQVEKLGKDLAELRKNM